ncbi:MAG: response regulator [Planctomycetaceae bacterium]|nr:response regulator [Planctomycetales bacterium]MCB9924989.1 response regulator [Planctomycetaceae bacterium]
MLLACGSAALALLLACVGFAWHSVDTLCDAKGRQLRDRAEIIAFQAGPALALRDAERGRQLLESLQADTTMIEARLYGNDRKTLATWGEQQSITAPVYSTKGYRFIGFSEVEAVRNVVVGSQRLGTIYLRANTSDLQQRLVDFAWIVGYVFVLAMLVVVLFATRLQRAISRPITELTKVAQEISINADYTIRVDGTAHAELKTLQDAFNHMLDRVQASEAAIQQAQNGLEDRVIARTQELSKEIRRRQEAQVELETAKEAAEAANRAKTEFLANMSHEIRTPLNGIMGFTEVLKNEETEISSEDRQDYLATIYRSGAQLVELINDILDVSKIEAGRFELDRVTCSPQQIITEVVSVLRVQAKEKGLQLEYKLASELPELIQSDPGRLRQLLMNLVGNAIKFTAEGTIRIVAGMIPSTPDQLQIEVSDTGIGIPREKLEVIFDPFSQADSSVTRRFGGTGLGLAISRKITEALGGRLTVQSEVGVGSVFRATIDTGSVIGQALIRTPDNSVPASASGHQSNIRFPGNRILIVDDGETNRKLIQLVLRRAGAEVSTASDGLQAIHITEEKKPELILMDMQMPVMDGYSATRELRSKGFKRPIIALTAHAMKGDEEKCLQAGCSGYLTKPVDSPQLLEIIARELNAIDGGTVVAPPVESSYSDASDTDAIYSTLPMDDDEFREIVVDFVDRMRDKLLEMRSVQSGNSFQRLAQLAHWLKGTGGTAGFAPLLIAAGKLEGAALAGNSAECSRHLSEIEQIAERIVVPRSAVR